MSTAGTPTDEPLVCLSCGGDFLHLDGIDPAAGDVFWVEMRCQGCDVVIELRLTTRQVLAAHDRSNAALESMRAAADALAHRRRIDEIARFRVALAADAILPEDFGRVKARSLR